MMWVWLEFGEDWREDKKNLFMHNASDRHFLGFEPEPLKFLVGKMLNFKN